MEYTKQLFTDDGIPVRTIYVSSLLGTTSIADLQKFCEINFGPVSAARIHQINNQNHNSRNLRSNIWMPMAYAFVTFTDTAAAFKAVNCKPTQLSFNGRPLRIKKADSWHQPTETEANVAGPSGLTAAAIAGPSGTLKSQVINGKMHNTAASDSPLVNLIDDGLHEIFKYLNIFDTVNMASTCTRLQYFVNENIYPKYVKFELKPDQIIYEEDPPKITLSVLRTMLQHFGTVIQDIDLHAIIFSDSAGRRHLQFVLKYCPNLRTLRLRSFTFNRNDHALLSKIPSMVKVIEMHECDGINDEWANVFLNFTELRTLIINGNKEFSGHLFRKFKNLEHLELTDCKLVKVQELNAFCKANGSSLRTLKLLNCTAVDQSVYQMISNKLPRIEDLTIELNNVSGPNQLNCLATLNHLKRLFIVCSYCNIGTYMRMLGDRGLLEELTVYGCTLDAETCDTFQKFQRLQSLKLLYPISEDEHMMDIIENADLPELRELYCEACNNITNDNLVALITSKRHLRSVDILYSNSVTFAAVRQIIEVLKSADDRPHLNLNIDTIEIGDEEKKILNDNHTLITVTTVAKCSKMDENYIEEDIDDLDDDLDDDDDYYDIDSDDTDMDDDFDIGDIVFAYHNSDDDDDSPNYFFEF